jgi:hypothetical protein
LATTRARVPSGNGWVSLSAAAPAIPTVIAPLPARKPRLNVSLVSGNFMNGSSLVCLPEHSTDSASTFSRPKGFPDVQIAETLVPSPLVNGTSLTAGPALLVVGHPGHELMVHGWLEAARPLVMVLTDGSGHTGVSRLPSTAALLGRAGVTPGTIFGRFTDVLLYRTLLERHTEVFVDLAEELADAICQHEIAVVAGDDAEGFNPTHDVCRLIIDAAVSTARRRGRSVVNTAFALMDAPSRTPRLGGASSSILTLNDAALERKLQAALRYPRWPPKSPPHADAGATRPSVSKRSGTCANVKSGRRAMRRRTTNATAGSAWRKASIRK